MTYTQKFRNQEGLVIFAGAGCSAAPPSSLPGWNDLNDAILDALWNRLEPYGLKTNFRENILTTIKQKRTENTFPPDYQAQLMVERAGVKYFELLSAVDSNTYNAVQFYTALLAEAGRIRAIVTTNFDKNFERALTQTGVDYKAYFDEEGFNSIANDEDINILPVIKIHGCSSSPSSMIDTRKQRLKGRAKALENLLHRLLESHYFIFCGFSGQDLDDNENYLGLRAAAPLAKGFTYLHRPVDTVRGSILKLIDYYGKNKAECIACDPVKYLEDVLKTFEIPFDFFGADNQNKLSIGDRLRLKVDALEPMDAVNMIIGLVESYGDEISARYLYDKVWRERIHADYDGDALPRFLLNHGRSYVFNFQNKKERAASAGVSIDHMFRGDVPAGAEETFTNPAKINLRHARNTSAETIGLIALAQTYSANPILFADYPRSLNGELEAEPSNTESADIIYYYSFYALVYDNVSACIKYLNFAINEMQNEFDEPRLAQLFSRRAMLRLRLNLKEMTELAKEDAFKARKLAEKYHEPNLLALSALALAVYARKKQDFDSAFKFIKEAEKNYSELKRIPQYIETIIEYLKVIHLGLEKNAFDKEELLKIVSFIKNNIESFIVERINVFEPEYCYLMGMILGFHSNVGKDVLLQLFADSISLARQLNQKENYNYFRETCRQHNILDEVEHLISTAKNKTVENN